jgi:DNA polymerase/3'-5' exonuclease PolX
MSVSTESLPLAKARHIADSLMNALMPGCWRIAPAGSIRREKDRVNDIEIVAIPRLSVDIFGDPDGATELQKIIARLVESGELKRIKGGDKYQQYVVVRHGCKLDLFLANADTWGCIYTIRTGSAEFSHRLVTPKSQGGLCPDGMRFSGGRLSRHGALLATPEEADVFRELGLDWIEPRDRK